MQRGYMRAQQGFSTCLGEEPSKFPLVLIGHAVHGLAQTYDIAASLTSTMMRVL